MLTFCFSPFSFLCVTFPRTGNEVQRHFCLSLLSQILSVENDFCTLNIKIFCHQILVICLDQMVSSLSTLPSAPGPASTSASHPDLASCGSSSPTYPMVEPAQSGNSPSETTKWKPKTVKQISSYRQIVLNDLINNPFFPLSGRAL